MQTNSIQHCFLIGLLFILSSCSDDKNYSESSLRGKDVYERECTKCHNSNPSKMGVNAPDIAGSSLETIKSMLLTGKPPVGQTPKDNVLLHQTWLDVCTSLLFSKGDPEHGILTPAFPDAYLILLLFRMPS